MKLSKIKAISIIIIGLFLVLATAPLVLAGNENGRVIKGSKLLITKVDAKVDGKSDKDLSFGDTIRKKAKPGSKVEFEIELTNNFTREQDLKIENIDTTVTIEGIDDGDDIDKDAKQIDLRADKNEKIKVSFELPIEVDEDTFTVLINSEGEDENGTSHEVEYEVELEVQKEDHEVRFLQNSLTPSEVKCGRTVQLSTSLINTGGSSEDGTTLQVSNAELGISFKDTFDLSDNAFDDDSKFKKTYTFTVPSTIEEGSYPINLKVTFNDGRDSKSDTADLIVKQCEISSKKEQEKPKDTVKAEDNSSVVVVQTSQSNQPKDSNIITAGTVTSPQLPVEEKSIFQSPTFLTALVAGEVLLVVIAILLVVTLARRRKE